MREARKDISQEVLHIMAAESDDTPMQLATKPFGYDNLKHITIAMH